MQVSQIQDNLITRLIKCDGAAECRLVCAQRRAARVGEAHLQGPFVRGGDPPAKLYPADKSGFDVQRS